MGIKLGPPTPAVKCSTDWANPSNLYIKVIFSKMDMLGPSYRDSQVTS